MASGCVKSCSGDCHNNSCSTKCYNVSCTGNCSGNGCSTMCESNNCDIGCKSGCNDLCKYQCTNTESTDSSRPFGSASYLANCSNCSFLPSFEVLST